MPSLYAHSGQAIGLHCILELQGCPVALLNDKDFVCQSLREAARKANSTLLNEICHCFEPQGITALALLAESHISIHTWPEAGYAAVDVFTCGQNTTPRPACQYLVQALQATHHTLQIIDRGSGIPATAAPNKIS